MPKEKKMLVEAKRIHAEANRLREFYISRNAEGRQRLMEMANAVNHDHFKTQTEELVASQLPAVKSEKPVVVAVEGVRSAVPSKPVSDIAENRASLDTEQYLLAVWETMLPSKAVANSPRWDFLVKRPKEFHKLFECRYKDTKN